MTLQDDQIGAKVLNALVAPEQGALRKAAVLSGLAALLWPLQAALVAGALAGLLTDVAPLWSYVAGFVLLGVLRAVLNHWSEGIAFTAGLRMTSQCRAVIVTREATRSTGPAAGTIAALAAEKLDLLLPYVSRYAPARARVMVVPVVILALAFWQSWAVGVVFLITGPLIPVFMALIGWAAQSASQRQMAEIGNLNDLLVERLQALIDIRVLGAGEAVVSSFAAAAERLRMQTMAVLRVAFLSSAVLELFAAIGVAMVAVYVGFSLLGLLGFGGYGTPLTPAAGIFLILLAPEFYQPLRDLSAAWHDRAAALAVAADWAEWQAQPAEPLLGQGASAARLAGPADIAVTGLRLRLGPRLLTLPDFQLAAGETLALLGPSGAGKTTLLRLLAGMLHPEVGQIRVAGQLLDDSTADGWRARLGWMPQQPHFLNASLRHNLSLGRPGDLSPALRAVAMQDVVAGLPQGLATRLGEGGGGLSGGEARRLTLARALHARPDVLLADEPTADLDAVSAEAVTAGLLALAATGCSLIIATHDEALAARMDRVIRLEPLQ
ncbi:thiol reductant ABC exporter subunit CydD [Cypionkella sp.]|uniref:thiol reductant ABC exporter subunit CydD n=1 Tax=Cypionkella sp. TaxID=2811411 RepID=UPI002AB80C85|nr:thiol reductant ABC exporter subunit CydD [Cypionkella sp.]MDZ4391934.1 thiol reductant ABC exporter subunit CydD [Cypionkella sp.]